MPMCAAVPSLSHRCWTVRPSSFISSSSSDFATAEAVAAGALVDAEDLSETGVALVEADAFAEADVVEAALDAIGSGETRSAQIPTVRRALERHTV